MTAYIDKLTGMYLVPTRDTYNGHIYCYAYKSNLFDYNAEYSHGAYFPPDRINFNPVDITPDYIR